jgi:hypothetical protein
MAAFIASRKREHRDMTVREFISQFRGLTATAKQREILLKVGASHIKLSQFFGSSERVNHAKIACLLDAMKAISEAVNPKLLGVIGKNHLLTMFERAGGSAATFTYERTFSTVDGIPRVLEFAFGVHQEGLKDSNSRRGRRKITGVNWSPGVSDPFRSLGRYGEGFGAQLQRLRVEASDPVFAFLHIACPRVAYLDRGKSSIVVE